MAELEILLCSLLTFRVLSYRGLLASTYKPENTNGKLQAVISVVFSAENKLPS